MRKANQIHDKAKITKMEGLETTLRYLDPIAAKHYDLSAGITAYKNNIKAQKSELTRGAKRLSEYEERREQMEKELSELPPSKYSKDNVEELLDGVVSLPWVQELQLNGEYIVLTTKVDALKTVFYNRLAYGSGERVLELLDKPLLLPMPQYDIALKLSNIGGDWDRNNSLRVRLHDPKALKFYAPKNELGLVPEGYAHWATSENPWFYMNANGAAEATWANLCLNEYARVLRGAAKTSLVDMFNEVVTYLQSAGWASAYRPKITWAVLLGYQPYYEQLLRPMMSFESVDSIQKSNRERLPKFLEDNGLSQHEYEYGSRPQLSAREAMDEEERIARRAMALNDSGAVFRGVDLAAGPVFTYGIAQVQTFPPEPVSDGDDDDDLFEDDDDTEETPL